MDSSTSMPTHALARIRPDGTGREVVYALDSLKNEVGVAWPEALPAERASVPLASRRRRPSADFRIMVRTCGRNSKVRRAGRLARYAPSWTPAYWVTGDGSLMAARFDPSRLELTGSPALLGAASVSARSASRTLRSARTVRCCYTHRLQLDDRRTDVGDAMARHRPVDAGVARWPRLFRGAVSRRLPGGRGIHQRQLQHEQSRRLDATSRAVGGLSRLTLRRNEQPAARNGRATAATSFPSDRGGSPALFRQRADGSAPAQRVASDAARVGRRVRTAPEAGLCSGPRTTFAATF